MIRQKFLIAFNELLKGKDFIVEDTKSPMAHLTNMANQEEASTRLRDEMAGISQNVRALVDRNARGDIDSNIYEREYRQLAKRYEDLENQLKAMEAACEKRKIQHSAMARFLKNLKRTTAPVNDFTPQLWNAVVEKATITADGSVVFTFKNGMEITVPSK